MNVRKFDLGNDDTLHSSDQTFSKLVRFYPVCDDTHCDNIYLVLRGECFFKTSTLSFICLNCLQQFETITKLCRHLDIYDDFLVPAPEMVPSVVVVS